jgi:hypothetical protein
MWRPSGPPLGGLSEDAANWLAIRAIVQNLGASFLTSPAGDAAWRRHVAPGPEQRGGPEGRGLEERGGRTGNLPGRESGPSTSGAAPSGREGGGDSDNDASRLPYAAGFEERRISRITVVNQMAFTAVKPPLKTWGAGIERSRRHPVASAG